MKEFNGKRRLGVEVASKNSPKRLTKRHGVSALRSKIGTVPEMVAKNCPGCRGACIPHLRPMPGIAPVWRAVGDEKEVYEDVRVLSDWHIVMVPLTIFKNVLFVRGVEG